MLWPIRWTGSSGNWSVIRSPSFRARRATPAVGWTRVTRTRLPAASRRLGDASEVPGERERAEPDPAEAEQTVSHDDRGGQAWAGEAGRGGGGVHDALSLKLVYLIR